MVSIEDEGRHRPTSADENWSESYYFSFCDDAGGTAGFFRFGLEENADRSNLWCCIFHGGRIVYQRFDFRMPYSAAGIEDVALGGLRMAMVEPSKRFTIDYEDRDLKVALVWEALHDVVDVHALSGRFSAAVASGHHEQNGIARGTILLRGQEIAVSGVGFRDHSWGVRDWEGVRYWKACAGQLGPDFTFHGAEIVDHQGEHFALGMVHRNGRTLPVSTLRFDIDDLATPSAGKLSIATSEDAFEIEIAFDPRQACSVPRRFNVVQENHVALRCGDRRGSGFCEINRSLIDT